MLKYIFRHIILIPAAVTAIVLPSAQSVSAKDVNDLRQTIDDRNIQYPESFEADTKAMLENWYLKNYAVLDRNTDNSQTINTSDEEYIERLSKIPAVIELPFNSLVRNHINLYTTKRRQLVENMLGLSMYYNPIFEAALDRYGLPLELKYLPVIESALNPTAVSRVGATGLWQFMLPTAQSYGLEKNSLIDQRCDPYLSSDAAARYLRDLYKTYGDWTVVLAAYNCGPGNVNKAMRRAGGGKKDFWEIYPFLPQETRGYVPAFIAATYVMNNFDKHNISPVLAKKPLVTDTVHVSKRVHFEQISEVLDIPIDELRVLNPQYRQDIIPGDIKPYSLVLPSLQVYAYVSNEDSIVNHNAAKYARRDVVEPSTGTSTEGLDSKGRYVEETVVKTHTVKRGENLTSIARKYGVTVASIRSVNRIGRSVRRGQKLNIHVTNRRYLPDTDSIADSTAVTAPAMENVAPDSTAVADTTAVTAPAVSPQPDTTATQHARPVTQASSKNTSSTNRSSRNTSAPKAKTYKVKSGDNLSKIAKRNGITVQQLKRANNLTSDNLQPGQKLTIPAKSNSRRRR